MSITLSGTEFEEIAEFLRAIRAFGGGDFQLANQEIVLTDGERTSIIFDIEDGSVLVVLKAGEAATVTTTGGLVTGDQL